MRILSPSSLNPRLFYPAALYLLSLCLLLSPLESRAEEEGEEEVRKESASQAKRILHAPVLHLEPAELSDPELAEGLFPGQGAVLVPSLITGRSEPPWALYSLEGKRLGSKLTGNLVMVEPGSYIAEVGSGSRNQLMRIPVTVLDGKVSRIEPVWGALAIHTVDEEETPFRGLYQLFEFLSRDGYGFGQGAEEELGENITTWLLKPSIYKIVGPLESFEAVTNFVTIEVLPNKVIHYVVVADRESGDFRGSGVVPTGDFTVRGSITGRPPRIQTGGFKIRARIGGDFSQSSSDNVLGIGGSSIGFGLFTDFSANYLWKKHLFNLIVDLEGGVRKNSDENFVRKVRDELSLNVIYIHQTWPLVGRYLRLSFTTQFADTYLRFDEPMEIITDGTSQGFVDSFQVSGSLSPLFLQEGAGLNFRLFKSVYGDLDARLGGSLRHTITSGFFIDQDDSETDAIELTKVGSSHQIGAEMVILGTARFGQAASYRNETNAFVSSGRELRFRSEHILSVRVVESLSVGLLLGLRKDDTTADELGFTQALFLRASKRVF